MPKAAVAAVLVHLAALAAGAQAPPPDARTTVRDAAEAVLHGDAGRLTDAWGRAVARDAHDRLATLGLATVARLTLHYDEADRQYAILLDRSQPVDRITIYAGLGHGEGLVTRGALTAGDSVLERTALTARAAHDSVPLVRARLLQASARVLSEGSPAAIALLHGVDRLIPSTDSALFAEYECTRVAVRAIVRPTEIRAVTQTSATLARRAGDRAVEALCRFQLADALMRLGDYSAAIPVLDTIETQLLPPFDRAHRAILRQSRAFSEEESGLYGPAMESVRRAIADAHASHNLPVTAFANLTLSRMYLALGDVTAAAEAADRAAAVFAKVDNQGGRMTAVALRAQIDRDAGDTDGARTAWTETRELARRYPDGGFLAASEEGIADIEAREGRWSASEMWLRTAFETSRHAHLRDWELDWWYATATLALRAGHPRQAETDILTALRFVRPEQHDQRYLTTARLAEIRLALGDTARAERLLGTASTELETWRSTLSERVLRVLAFQRQASFGGPDPSVARVIAAVARSGRTAAAFELAERRRARDLSDQLARVTALDRDSSPRPVGASTTAPVGESSLLTVKRALPDDSTLFLEYVTGPGGAPTTMFAVTRAAVRAFVLPPADSLAVDVERFVALITSGNSAIAQSDILGAALLWPALADRGGAITRIVIVPDGPLQRLPFAALRLPGHGYVVERYALSFAPSGLVAAQIALRPAAAPAPASILAFGDPNFSLEQAASAADGEFYRGGLRAIGDLPRLPASAEEARTIARFGARSVVRLRDSASARYFKQAPLDSFSIIHLATHAIVDDRATTRTALALAPSPGESGFITPADLWQRHLRADLVVLSACRAAGGVLVAGEGVRGLTTPLLGAGARAVVASQWEIGDKPTVSFMHEFYEALSEDHLADRALQLAQLTTMRRGAPVRQWAAFTITGDPSVRVVLTKPRFEWLWSLLGR
jgi:tetratricopeptide (TPR) repeat protein